MCIYGVINIDMINSRKLSNRSNIQSDLKNYIRLVNSNYQKYLLAPITITLGDEWQIVVKDLSKSYKFVELFQKFLEKYEVDIYAGIGVGTLSTEIYEDTRLMDGECFIKAREALDIVKDNNRFYQKLLHSNVNNVFFKGSEIFIHKLDTVTDDSRKEYAFDEVAASMVIADSLDCFGDSNNYSDDVSLNMIINALIENTEVLKRRITKKQFEIIELYKKEGSYNNIIKKNPNISKASISQKLHASNYFLIENNRLIIDKLFKVYHEIRKGNKNEI
ncbi:hypothetical protein DW1_0425 [Proteiniborus sp. DW1]|uniref:SatD family protein n=1 Tax=Proteiniborus sp. DW1 TaxID=1889883 RepID=UPI00092E0ACD|nr:SatD family protein [Proteiniborus sp. DW1]SCG82045.1 hypothetical protein DW1_0425 [Proteiniborus sp. DW1]